MGADPVLSEDHRCYLTGHRLGVWLRETRRPCASPCGSALVPDSSPAPPLSRPAGSGVECVGRVRRARGVVLVVMSGSAGV